ncbi:similar to Saccharomyces cerevisiae YBR023C CHS3 Chitin synthase III, catalyzes the transfer of N-acetylglucosamine (GlcNAc) to chitin [Maudiozyma saulgeensis]|uniref:chitin synthase n=1 Tax=Maudiozyma saulgeensis TaxID=1789683 RepID=A0A1X7R3Q5_9SACH|nr:similar to Saccharomyces cerevisiae YBR023C CHS3 Chitin synthase III, catalyzes the transfer of N-acetylglucosamine (GlcNAc) to chitin [Kazachstania saulgeensis]
MDEDNYYLHLDDEHLIRPRASSASSHPRRQGSLVRPERNRLDNPSNPSYYYAQKTAEQKNRLSVLPSSTGVNPTTARNSTIRSRRTLSTKRGSSIIEEEYPLRDISNDDASRDDTRFNEEQDGLNEQENEFDDYDESRFDPYIPDLRKDFKKISESHKDSNSSISLWTMYCKILTFWIPGPVLALFGMPDKERQMAWRDKIALLSIICYIGAIVAYITFGFTRTVCPNSGIRLENNDIDTGFVTINGKAYIYNGTSTDGSDLQVEGKYIVGPWQDAGKDATFLFQNVNGNCKNVIVPKDNCSIPYNSDKELAWYFPCKMKNIDGSSKPNFTRSEHYDGWGCHTSNDERKAYYNLKSYASAYFTWDDIKNSSRNLVVYNGDVLDLNLLNWLESDDLDYPTEFDDLKNSDLQGYDLSLVLSTGHDRKIARCLNEIIKVGEIDSKTVGCLASDVVLYVSLIFIFAIIVAKFLVASYFRWFVSKKQGAFEVDNKTMDRYINTIEDWSDNIYAQGPIKQVDPSMRPVKKESGLSTLKKKTSRMLQLNDSVIDLESSASNNNIPASGTLNGYTTMTSQNAWKFNGENDPNEQRQNTGHRSDTLTLSSLLWNSATISPAPGKLTSISSLDPTIIHPDIVQQPPIDYMPYDYPLIHTICFVTCYSEDESGLRTTLDSISTTDYPNSHKLIMIVCDGLIKGSGNDKTTPEIALDMMDDFVVPPEEVQANSYVAVASGTKRHNMAKIYAGFYKYDDETVPLEKQQRVPVITIVKCGTPEEQGSAKPGNRGKRDSQVILMSFLQRITFDERMSELEFQLLKNIWQLTGLMADFYETVLMVDADTKVFPDSLSHMVAEMVKDPTIMGLCGETKIANKADTWVTAIQVFEYYISHHQSKAFESVFGSVTCLPGCFSLYRIKSPKGADGYWVPILANPDIVERYSDNVTNTLHRKNLLLLGEDRYLSSLMLRTFPKRKQIFVSKAACKTVVPDEFKVLLSQRRRWINSTVHNLFELVLIRDLCGTFCFSMQFVIFIELIGTLVLPLAICFSVYVIMFAILSHPTPVLTLILLGLVLGLPGVLVVVTATRWSYLMWLAVYICALPIWNLVLPSYAYWKFDDFSWGDTRTIAGGNKVKESEEGEFDHSHIKMRTWREFDREERMMTKTGGIDADPSKYI